MDLNIDTKVWSHLKLNERNEDGEKHKEDYLHLFRKAIKDLGNISCPPDDVFLLRFLRTKKFNVTESVQLLQNYFEMKLLNPDLMKFSFTSVKSIYDKKILTVMRERDCKGRKILYFRFAMWNPVEVLYEEILVAGFFLLEEITRSETTQKDGIVAIVDGDQLSFNQARMIAMQFNLSKIRKLSLYLQARHPARFKDVHIINCPPVINIICAMMKFFLSEKLKRRTHIHGRNITSLSTFIKAEVLPEHLGGLCSMHEKEDTDLMQSMFDREDYYERLHHTYGYQIN